MSSRSTIRVENLGKRYRIGAHLEPYRTLRDQIARAATLPWRRFRSVLRGESARHSQEDLWAIREVSLSISSGEVVGLIGRNGAGKTTLLKVLSRITQPTEGRALIRGRVGSLLEVGTGFHPELTGRENIFLNGAILGMGRIEIRRKLDEIVAFAEVERFLDTAVKHYSSGMHVRLAFSVAAHLETEVLLVDEVLAVGDAAFQRKCMGRMEHVAQEGRTIVFVSHQLSSIRQLCSRAILLEAGRVVSDGLVEDVVEGYLVSTLEAASTPLGTRGDREGGTLFRFTSAAVVNPESGAGAPIAGKAARFDLQYESNGAPLRNVALAIHVEDLLGRRIFTLATSFTGQDFDTLPPAGTISCHVPTVPLVAGEYKLFLWASVNGLIGDKIHDALRFEVLESDVFRSGRMPSLRLHGPVLVPHSWNRQVQVPTAVEHSR